MGEPTGGGRLRGALAAIVLVASACSSTVAVVETTAVAPTAVAPTGPTTADGRVDLTDLFATTAPPVGATTTTAGAPLASPSQVLFVGDPGIVFRTLLPQAFQSELTGLIDDFTTATGEHWGVTKATPLGDKLLVMVERRADPATAGRGFGDVIGGGLWTVAGGQWQLLSFSTELATLAGFEGNPFDPEDEPRALGEHLVAVYENAVTGQGVTSEDVLVVGDVDDRLTVVLELDDASGSNEGVCPQAAPCYAFASELVIEERADGAWPSLVVLTSGTRLDDRGAVVSAARQRTFAFADGAYRERP